MTMDQSASDFIDNLLKKEDEFGYTVYLAPVSSSTLQNHKIGRAGCGRIIYVIADIYPHNLNANSTAIPTEYIRNWISQGGYACDKVGFIVPTEFGGSAEYFNMITLALDNDKKEVHEFLMANQQHRYATVEFGLEYIKNGYKFYHPQHIYYRFVLHEHGTVTKHLSNKLTNTVSW